MWHPAVLACLAVTEILLARRETVAAAVKDRATDGLYGQSTLLVFKCVNGLCADRRKKLSSARTLMRILIRIA